MNFTKDKIDSLIKIYEKNNYKFYFFESKDEAVTEIISQLQNAKSISRGGSVTFDQIGLIDKIKLKNLPFRDYLSKEDRVASVSAQYYLSGSNAITMDGKIVNTDGAGNRIAALSFGPEKVFIIVGVNKIVENEEKAFERIKNIAAPMNAKRLNRKTPCVETHKCMDCSSPDRICRKNHVITKPEKDRFSIFVINENLGY